MIGIVMAGGKGTRMKLDEEKLLLQYKKPIILHVLDSLKNSNCFSKILVVTSCNSPKTKNLVEKNNFKTFDSPGIGYVEDLNLVLQNINESVFVVSGDLPLLDEEITQKITNSFDPEKTWTSILVTNKFLTSLGLHSDYSINFENNTCHYTGISLINSEKISSLENVVETFVIIDDKRIAFNLNSKQDYDLLGAT
ncbi:NTP transferase domain-containing protein [Nitrosopumilus sp.]|uniref:NTP transferase domain-containing protein n=1 Tax=Nitrosopumilus sp. TaxID=2024843 RepID=UPI00247E5BD3|nr:NTP transferase domain-containing protein [Nitrosopumilus sp.]MCV0430980.1 NTP transferase domain-containing protein [Nitrosopumilus sp.]